MASEGTFTVGVDKDYSLPSTAAADSTAPGAGKELIFNQETNVTETAGSVWPAATAGTLRYNGGKYTTTLETANVLFFQYTGTAAGTVIWENIYIISPTMTASRAAFYCQHNDADNPTTILRNCRGNGSGSANSSFVYVAIGANGGTFKAYNNIAYNYRHTVGASGFWFASGTNIECENCVVDGAVYSYMFNSLSLTIKNCVSINSTTANVRNATNATSVNCGTNAASIGCGTDTSPQTRATVANEFVNTTITDWTDGYKIDKATSEKFIGNGASPTITGHTTSQDGRTYDGAVDIGVMQLQRITGTMSLSVTSGTTAGSTATTISTDGTGFRPTGAAAPTVTVDGNAATVTGTPTQTSCGTTTPAGTRGAKNVIIANADGYTLTGASAYTYLQAINITGVTRSGATLTISGTGFIAAQGDGTVTWQKDGGGYSAVDGITSWGDTEITATLNTRTPGTYDIKAKNQDELDDVEASAYTIATPSINVTGRTGATITWEGTALGASGTVQFKKDDGDWTNLDATTTYADTSGEGTVNTRTPGDYQLRATNPDGNVATDTTGWTVAAISLTSVAYDAGAIDAGGSGFYATRGTGKFEVRKQGGGDWTELSSYTSWANDDVKGPLADTAAGTYDGRVTNSDGNAAEKLSAFEISGPGPEPSVAEVTKMGLYFNEFVAGL